jgi:hypothetical protein
MNPSALHRLQIFVGVAVGPSVFGKVAPSYFHLFAGPSTLTRLTAWASWQASFCRLITGTASEPRPSAAIEGFGR